MITPIRTLTIQQICERKEDLLMSADDIKKVARNARNKAIDEFAEMLCVKCEEMACTTTIKGVPIDILTLDCTTDEVLEIAGQLKGGAE